MYSLEWYCMVMESLIWNFMVRMILCGLVWFSIVYYAYVFPCKVSNGLVWLCMVLYDLTQLCTIFVLVFLINTSFLNITKIIMTLADIPLCFTAILLPGSQVSLNLAPSHCQANSEGHRYISLEVKNLK